MRKRLTRSHRIGAMLGIASLTVAIGAFAFPEAAMAAVPDANTIVSGVVFNGDNAAFGATVSATLWPNSTVLAGLADGTTVPSITLGPVSLDSQGNYVIDADPASIPSTYLDPTTGAIDVEVDVTFNNGVTAWNTSVVPGSSGANWLSAFGTGAAPVVSFVLGWGVGGSAIITESGNDPSQSLDGSGNLVGGASSMSANTMVTTPDGATQPCVRAWTATSTTKSVAEHYLDAYGWSGAKVLVTQDVSSSHTLGIATSVGASSYFTASGSSSKTISSGIEKTGLYGGGEAIYNRVLYTEYQRGVCGVGIEHQWRPTAIQTAIDPSLSHSISHPMLVYGAGSYCGELDTNQTFTKHSGKSYSYSTGVALTGVYKAANVSLSVSAENDFSSDATEYWAPTQKSMICGDSSLGESSKRVEVEAYPTGGTGGGGCALPPVTDIRKANSIRPSIHPIPC